MSPLFPTFGFGNPKARASLSPRCVPTRAPLASPARVPTMDQRIKAHGVMTDYSTLDTNSDKFNLTMGDSGGMNNANMHRHMIRNSRQ